MRIGVIAADIIPEHLGGAEVHFVEVAKRLAQRRHHLDLFVGREREVQRLFPKGVDVQTVWYPRIPNLVGLAYILFAPHQIIKELRQQQVDLIWAKQVYPQGVVGAIVARRTGKPLYITAQNPLDYKEELMMSQAIPFKRFWPHILTPLVSLALRSADIVACVSRYAEKQARKLGARRTTIIANGVDTKQFKVQSVKRKVNKKIRIVTTSALIPRNGLDTLIEAVSLLPRHLDWELLIAGEGPLERNLKSQVSNLKLQGRVKFLGRVENRNIRDLLASADLFVRLSRKEGFGVSFLEAMAVGIPVIATPVGGIVDFIKHRDTGFLVSPDHPQQAAEAFERLLADTDLNQTLRRNGRNLVETRYNWDRIADEVEKVLISVA